MKKLFKKALIIIACLCVLPLASCGEGIKGDEAKAYINDFFAEIVVEDYEKAEELLHPKCLIDIEKLFLNFENPQLYVAIFGTIFVSGVIITLIATFFAVNKYIRHKIDDLYYL
jgi:methyl coenzyme M reductase alpha subunit